MRALCAVLAVVLATAFLAAPGGAVAADDPDGEPIGLLLALHRRP